ncbi:class I SAM-dependent methyltransferase [Sphingomonas koreensis]|nr:class I SAM-dependent methyltransferase [Sphingomonas koreensis]
MTLSRYPSITEIYQRHGAAWAERRGDALVEAPWLDRFCTSLPAGAAILDIGCGSGLPIGRALIDRGFDLTGIDAAPTMLALFRRNLPEARAHLIDMRQLALNRRFAGLLAWDSFFHLSPDDQRAMFPRFKAHAAPGAALMFTSGNVEGEAIGTLQGDPLYHGSLDREEYRRLLAATGFAVVAHVVGDPASGDRTIWLAQQRG